SGQGIAGGCLQLVADHDISSKVDQLDELAGRVLRPGVSLRHRAVGFAETPTYAGLSLFGLPSLTRGGHRSHRRSAPVDTAYRVRGPAGLP
ncbi:hypothetical protein, partial [Bradyrhizobium sp.]|uniref:hypothetical protein n=1 Tax=Bradyrhizobium sp. TaxID=376 RepID=UPI003C672AD6